MILRLLRQAIFLLLVVCYFEFTQSSIFEQTNKIDISSLAIWLFAVYLAFECLLLLFRFVVSLIKKDVLISNHDFLGDKESIEIINSTQKEKIVLSRNQFDEAAILIVKAMSAITSGLMNDARRHLVNLRKIIGNDAIIDILMLKIYKGEKNFDKIELLSQKLMQNEDIQLVGMKAAFEAQVEKKEFNEALKTVNQAFEIRQDLYWVIGSAFLLRAQNKDWLGALEVLDAGIDKKIMPEAKASRLRAVALYELSKEALKEKDNTKFFKFINKALDENSKLVPAALDLANYYVRTDSQKRKAERVLSRIWLENPTYEIAIAYLNLFEKDTKTEKIQRMEKLALSNSKRPSLNNIILAELYIKARKFAKARSECKIFLLKNPATQKIVSLLEILEEKGSKKSYFNSKTDKNDYAKDFQWICANCGKTHNTWEAICDNCGEVGRIYWHLYIDKDNEDFVDEE